MNFLRMTTGLVAVALLAGPALAQEEGSPPEQPAERAAPAEDGAGAANTQASAIRKFLMLQVPVGQMNVGRLEQRRARAAEYLQIDGLAPDQRQGLENEMAEIEAELARRAAAEAKPEAQPEAQPELQPEVPKQAEQVPAPAPAQPEVRKAKPRPAIQPAPAPQEPQEESVAAPAAGSSAKDAEVRALLAQRVDVGRLSDRQLRQRLDTMRELLASRRLSKPVQRELRQALADERRELRRRVASEEQGAETLPPDIEAGTVPTRPPQPQAGNRPRPQPGAGFEIDPDETMGGYEPEGPGFTPGPPPEQLSEAEIRRRIMQRRALQRDARLSPEQRAAWREASARDREYLHERMIDDRRRRERDLRTGTHDWDFDIDVGIGVGVGRPWRRDVFAAEARDEDLVGVLVSPARRSFDREYSIEEIERTPQLREAVARIEIDTVNFGFGESFLREEEIENLDRIGRILEEIVARNPGEVFMIEGHTDAVGSAESNLVLSRQRAQAVKQALTRYYVIAPENLRAVGLGERFLKIPTEEAEAENRRVSVARITPLVGALDE